MFPISQKTTIQKLIETLKTIQLQNDNEQNPFESQFEKMIQDLDPQKNVIDFMQLPFSFCEILNTAFENDLYNEDLVEKRDPILLNLNSQVVDHLQKEAEPALSNGDLDDYILQPDSIIKNESEKENLDSKTILQDGDRAASHSIKSKKNPSTPLENLKALPIQHLKVSSQNAAPILIPPKPMEYIHNITVHDMNVANPKPVITAENIHKRFTKETEKNFLQDEKIDFDQVTNDVFPIIQKSADQSSMSFNQDSPLPFQDQTTDILSLQQTNNQNAFDDLMLFFQNRLREELNRQSCVISLQIEHQSLGPLTLHFTSQDKKASLVLKTKDNTFFNVLNKNKKKIRDIIQSFDLNCEDQHIDIHQDNIITKETNT